MRTIEEVKDLHVVWQEAIAVMSEANKEYMKVVRAEKVAADAYHAACKELFGEEKPT